MRKRLIVRGFVQGVGYRTFVKIIARQYGLRGKARNLEDGNVEIIVDAKSNDVLNEFIKRINIKGELPFEPSVKEIKVEDYKGKEELPTFTIDYGYEMSVAEREMIERSEIGIIAFGWMGKYLAGKMDNGFNELGNKMGKGFSEMGEKMDKGFSDTGQKLDRIGNMLEENLQKTDTLIEKTDSFHSDMINKFEYLDEKYGEFSGALERIEGDIREMKDAFIELVNHLLNKK